MMNKNTAWYNTDILPEQMVKGARAELGGFKRLENSSHFNVLNQLFGLIKNDVRKIGEVGCGAGEISRVYGDFDYIGADLPHIIDKVAKVVNPNSAYIGIDAYEDSFDFLSDCDIVIMNSFLSELDEPLSVLDKILKKSKKYVLIHRQDFNDTKNELQHYRSYGGITTTNSSIFFPDFDKTILRNNFLVKKMVPKNPSNQTTILLEKNEDTSI